MNFLLCVCMSERGCHPSCDSMVCVWVFHSPGYLCASSLSCFTQRWDRSRSVYLFVHTSAWGKVNVISQWCISLRMSEMYSWRCVCQILLIEHVCESLCESNYSMKYWCDLSACSGSLFFFFQPNSSNDYFPGENQQNSTGFCENKGLENMINTNTLKCAHAYWYKTILCICHDSWLSGQ